MPERSNNLSTEIASLEARIEELTDFSKSHEPSKRDLKRAQDKLEPIYAALRKLAESVDPVKRPRSVFDPSDPETAGRIVALTLAAQGKHSLANIPQFYGAGVYALYYNGNFTPYRAISNKEHPIYVGKADPQSPQAKDAVQQGSAISKRLLEHAKNISKATTLNLEDFQCRFLIVQSGFQASAETYLINFFKPIWNKETNICFGIGKHGDSSKTRGNARSPWDTLHPGRAWANSSSLDQRPKEKIIEQIESHFHSNPPFNTFNEIINQMMGDVRQLT